MHSRRLFTRVTGLVGLVALTLALSACAGQGGEPLPTGARQVSGVISLPPGHGLDVSSLKVVTQYGEYPVEADGKYTALVMLGADAELGVETESGELLLLGASDGASAPLSLHSTAEALIYYLIGGMWLPPEHQDTIRDLLRGRSEAGTLASHLERLLLAGEYGLTAPDQPLRDALEAVRTDILGGSTLLDSLATFPVCPALLHPAAAGDVSVIIHDGTTEQAGALVLHNPDGLGVVAMNTLRRPAALLAYEVAWEDVDQNVTPVDPPELVTRVEVPATGNLELFAAIGDILTGDAPWMPVLSPGLVLSGRPEATATEYELVLIGPSLTADTLPIWWDSRFTAFHDEWDDIRNEKMVELVLNEMVLPLVTTFAFGSVAKLSSSKLAKARQDVKNIYDNHLLQLGVYLKSDPFGGHVAGLKFVLEELAVNRQLRSDMIDMLEDALTTSERHRHAVEAIDKRLAARASASAIVFAVEAVLVGGDVGKIIADLATTPAVASWAAEAFPARFIVDPPFATITTDSAAAKFNVQAVGDPPVGNYLFRWSTSGNHGVLFDYFEEGLVLETTSPEVWYYHDDPIVLKTTDTDTILVEVFLVEPGVTEVPVDARPIGKGQATVSGRVEEDLCVWECDDDGICYIYCP